jgi:hypothetical protein
MSRDTRGGDEIVWYEEEFVNDWTLNEYETMN